MFDIQTRSSGTRLTVVTEDRPRRPNHRLFHVRIGKHDVGTLAAEFERHPFERARRIANDRLGDAGAAREADFVDAGVRDQRRARRFTKARQHIEHPRREADFLKQLR